MKHILRILLLALTLLGACTKGGQSDTPGGSALEVDDPEGKLMVSEGRIEVSPERPIAGKLSLSVTVVLKGDQ